MTTPADPQPHEGFAARLREATADAHRAAEHAPYVQDLMGGRLPLEDYVRLVVQYEAIYRSLEALVARNQDPTVAPFLTPELTRLPALHADLLDLAGPDWAERFDLCEATTAYVEHMEAAVAAWPRALLAHHYVRYLGDLSGGQVIGRVLQRVYQLADGVGTSFYRFADIASPKAHKVRYRELLEELPHLADHPWDAADLDRLIVEASAAYRFNADVFFELAPLPRLASHAHLTQGRGTAPGGEHDED